ncbi:exported hypothetical protein [Frankia sp. Hr75.2]|nr:exported hypothetical protein [Frankia sp. Hr75.2]
MFSSVPSTRPTGATAAASRAGPAVRLPLDPPTSTVMHEPPTDCPYQPAPAGLPRPACDCRPANANANANAMAMAMQRPTPDTLRRRRSPGASGDRPPPG